MMLLQVLAHGQATTWKVKKTIDHKAIDVKIDQLSNLYIVDQGEVIKLDDTGKELTRFSNKRIGEGIFVDVSNPMKVLVFSPDQMRLIFLDSRMSELRQEIDLFSQGYEQISLAATSHSNGFWLYDPIDFKLIRYDQFFKKERESLNIAQFVRVEFYPTDLKEVDNKVYLTDPMHGIFVFDLFGNYLRKIPLKDIPRLVISDGRLFFKRGSSLFAFNLRDSSEELVIVEGKLSDRFDVNRARLVSTSSSGVIIFEPSR